jgi:ribosomal protein S18 acetylase RimI-like enzyme
MLAAADGCRDAGVAQYDRRVVSEHADAVVRPARPDDVEAIAALHLASWRTAYKGFLPDDFLSGITLESRILRWQQALDPSASPLTETTVADADGTVLGVCSFGPRREPASETVGAIYVLHVRPDVTRRGLGKALLDEALRRLAARGFGTSVLWVFTRPKAGRSLERNSSRTEVALRSRKRDTRSHSTADSGAFRS